MTVADIRDSLPSHASARRQTVYDIVKRMIAYGFLEFRFKSARSREVRIKSQYVDLKPLSAISDELRLTNHTGNTGSTANFHQETGGE